ncbi:hypothetical protein XENTR_v10018860 [Xenopus tropicalis]|nr:hypothetical protein XENTR_v10018860 [Xenopus tropicalis]
MNNYSYMLNQWCVNKRHCSSGRKTATTLLADDWEMSVENKSAPLIRFVCCNNDLRCVAWCVKWQQLLLSLWML